MRFLDLPTRRSCGRSGTSNERRWIRSFPWGIHLALPVFLMVEGEIILYPSKSTASRRGRRKARYLDCLRAIRRRSSSGAPPRRLRFEGHYGIRRCERSEPLDNARSRALIPSALYRLGLGSDGDDEVFVKFLEIFHDLSSGELLLPPERSSDHELALIFSYPANVDHITPDSSGLEAAIWHLHSSRWIRDWWTPR